MMAESEFIELLTGPKPGFLSTFAAPPDFSSTFFKFPAGDNFAKQHDATMLPQLHHLVKQTKGLLRLGKNLRVDRCAVKAVSLQPRLDLGGGPRPGLDQILDAQA